MQAQAKPGMEKIIEVDHLSKRFGSTMAVDDISFEVHRGEIVGLLGPNGAGKTTTISMLLGLTKPSAGNISIFGLDLARHRQMILKKIGYASADLRMQDRLTVFENLLIFAMLFELEDKRNRIEELLYEMEITDLKKVFFGELSSGQQTRVILCKALLNKPELLLLDEPTASLDPDISGRVESYLLKIQAARKTAMLYTSHDMSEVSRLCNRLIFLSQGKIVAQDTPANLTKMFKDTVLELVFTNPQAEVQQFCRQENLNCYFPEKCWVSIKIGEEKITPVLARLNLAGIKITDINIKKPDLNSVFIKLAREAKHVAPKN